MSEKTAPKSSLQSILSGAPMPDLPAFDPSWDLKKYNEIQDDWKRKLIDYIRRLIGSFTAVNIINEITQNTTTVGNFTGTGGVNLEMWLEFAWPHSGYDLYANGPVYESAEFNANPQQLPIDEKPFWTGSLPLLRFDMNVLRAIPYVEGSGLLQRWVGMRLTGFLTVRYSETYTLTFDTNDGIRVWIDDKLLINDWTSGSTRTNTLTFAATVGQRYKLRIEYFNSETDGHLYCTWQSSSQSSGEIPYHFLFRR